MAKYNFPKHFKTDKFQKVRLSDIAILLNNVWAGAKDPQIGFEDADQTLHDLTQNLNHDVWIKISDLESALWACNLMSESDKFIHPIDLPFQEFVTRLLKPRRFNKIYNTIEVRDSD